jgi:hypothetical protein
MSAKRFCVVAGVVAGLVFGGCSSIPEGAERGPDGTMAYDVLVDASSPGARIQVNGTIVGNTPMHLKIFGDPDGTFHDFGSYNYVVAALPLTTNQFPQSRFFQTGHALSSQDHIPQQIYFDMNQPVSYAAPNLTPPTYYSAPPPVIYAPAPYPYYYGPGVRVYVGPRYHYYRRGWR